jgi:predicted transcriptional regulator
MTFDVLHTLRLKGMVSVESLAALVERSVADVQAELDGLAADGLVRLRETPRLTGWSLTPEGHARHAEEIAALRTPEIVSGLTPLYEDFLRLNDRVKGLSTSWQQLAADDRAGRWEAIEKLDEVLGEAAAILIAAAGVVPRFRSYERRLASALEQLRTGDERFFTGVTVDSCHTVWFECHEDLIQTLGRDRVQEGSF